MVAMSPGYLGGIWAQAKQLRGHGNRLWILLPAAMIGGLAGAVLLLNTEEQLFRAMVPYLILGASLTILLQEQLKTWLARLHGMRARSAVLVWAIAGSLLFVVGLYGGYFFAGLSILVMGVLGLVTTKRGGLESKDDLKRRIGEAARYVPLEQLCLSPQCGFSSTVEGNELTEEQQWAKLRLIVDVAREIWGD